MKQESYDLLIVDAEVPEVLGVVWSAQVPTLIMVNEEMSGSIACVLPLGIWGFLVKPFTASEFSRVVAKTIDKADAVKDAMQQRILLTLETQANFWYPKPRWASSLSTFWKSQPLIGASSLLSIPLITKEVRDFILRDTSQNEFVLNQYECRHFATEVNNNAEAEGLRCAFVLLGFERGQHAVVAFDTTEKGLVYIEPQTDAAIHPKVGGKYQGKEIKEILIAW